MAENVTVARPYADAAFELARAGGSLDAWADVLARLAVVVTDEQVVRGIHDPALSRERLARFVIEVAGKGVTEEQGNFVHLLAENDRLALLPEIRELFLALKDKEEGVLVADVASAFPLDDATLAQIRDDLSKRFHSRIQTAVRIDPELIGGVRIAVNDEVIDASVRGKLAAMAASLKN